MNTRAAAADEVGRVLVDSAPSPDIDLDDATKVQLHRARVSTIGKELDTWDAIDAGRCVLTNGVFDALRAVPFRRPANCCSAPTSTVPLA